MRVKSVELLTMVGATIVGEFIFEVARNTTYEPGPLSIIGLVHVIWLGLVLGYTICAWRDMNKSMKGEMWKPRRGKPGL